MSGPVPPVPCRWFALCTNLASRATRHPVLGDVPTCARCEAKHIALGGNPVIINRDAVGALDPFPSGTRVHDEDGDVWVRQADGSWQLQATTMCRSGWALLNDFGPVRLIGIGVDHG